MDRHWIPILVTDLVFNLHRLCCGSCNVSFVLLASLFSPSYICELSIIYVLSMTVSWQTVFFSTLESSFKESISITYGYLVSSMLRTSQKKRNEGSREMKIFRDSSFPPKWKNTFTTTPGIYDQVTGLNLIVTIAPKYHLGHPGLARTLKMHI